MENDELRYLKHHLIVAAAPVGGKRAYEDQILLELCNIDDRKRFRVAGCEDELSPNDKSGLAFSDVASVLYDDVQEENGSVHKTITVKLSHFIPGMVRNISLRPL